MEINEKIKYWVDLAEYDLETARAMLDTKRYLYVGFMCHQVIEKSLKAYYVKIINQPPPFTHNLRFLCDITGLAKEIDNSILLFLSELQPLNIEGRYPTYKDTIFNLLTKEKCESLIEKTEDLFKWIKQKL
ncbi:MAG: HEPN domain-containing protein [Candidatus Kapabacteria bacterium]|nr:HEPN domain-containing protein [Candidatus Kapabacteria bacterium]